MSDLYYLLQQLSEKREQLIRLKNTKSTILSLQIKFVKHESTVDEPELTPYGWNGSNARSFVDKREVVMSSYKDIAYSQIGDAIKVIDDRISSIQVAILKLEINIETEKARIENERKVKNN